MVLALLMSSPEFDDVGRQQHVELAVDEILHGVFDGGRRELAVRHGHADLGHQLAQLDRDLGQVLDARADIEGLAAAILFAQQGLSDGDAVERRDEGAHGQAIDRRRGDQAHVAHAGQSELQGARDRRGGERQHMDVGAQLLQPLLVGDAEMLLLVDDQQAEILELDALGQQGVGADHDVERALLHRLPGGLRLLGADQPRQPPDPHRQALEALDEGPVMLARQQRRRADHRHLLAREGGDEGRAQRHLGLAEADIAADQAIHRLARRHVFQHVGDRLELVVGLGIGEAGAELLVETVGRAHRLAAADGALGGDLDQPVGHVGDALLQPGLARLPGDAAQAVELGALLARAVAAQHVDVLDRNEELVAALVGQPQAIVARELDFQRHQALVAADAVLAMDDQVALAERRRLGDEALRRAALLGRPRQPVA